MEDKNTDSELREALVAAQVENARLQAIIDNRPAINAGLPQTYIDWSQSIYTMEAMQAMGIQRQ